MNNNAKERRAFTVLYGVYDVNKIINHRETFGWKLIDFNSTHANMERDIDFINNKQIQLLEQEYEKAFDLYGIYQKRSRGDLVDDWVRHLLIILVIPAVIYYVYKRMMYKKSQRQIDLIENIINDAKSVS